MTTTTTTTIDALASAPLTGAHIAHRDDDSITIRPDGARECSGDATVLIDDEGRLWLAEAGDRVPFEGALQDIVDAWDHA